MFNPNIYSNIFNYKDLVLLLSFSQSRQCLLRGNGDGGLVRRMTFSRMRCEVNVMPFYCSRLLHDGCIFFEVAAKTNDNVI